MTRRFQSSRRRGSRVFIDPPSPKVSMYYQVRIYTFALLFVAFFGALVFGQGAKIRSPYEPIQDQDRDQPKQREQWFMHGRTIRGQSAAALRYRAHLQKMQLRAACAAAARNAAMDALPLASALKLWAPLGPAPLASDATGFGGQDYNWVSGRATAVAVDPADSAGNTVYVGGAYGGGVKNTNAAPLAPTGIHVTPAPTSEPTEITCAWAFCTSARRAAPTKRVGP